MSTLYPIIRRVRRALLPPEEVRLVEKVEPPSPQPSDSVAPAPSALGGPSLGANSFRRFPSDSSPPGEGEASPVVVESAAVVAPVEVVTVEMAPVVSEVLATPPVVATADQSLLTSAAMGKKATPHPGPLPDRGGEGGDDQSLLTSAATKGMKGKQAAAKSRVKAIDEAHSDQP